VRRYFGHAIGGHEAFENTGLLEFEVLAAKTDVEVSTGFDLKKGDLAVGHEYGWQAKTPSMLTNDRSRTT
jgi:hypothetical protein